MDRDASYPNLSFLIHAYFNEDFDVWGDSVGELVSCFKEESDKSSYKDVIDEIERFKLEHSTDLEKDFDEIYGLYVKPEPWGHTTASFLDELKRLLSE